MTHIYYHQWRKRTIEYLGGKCIVCGTIENLEFDHIDENIKEFDISKFYYLKNEKLQNEINKCQLLCKIHHKEKTNPYQKENGLKQGITHGSIYAFRDRKCDCEICLLAKEKFRFNKNVKRRKNF